MIYDITTEDLLKRIERETEERKKADAERKAKKARKGIKILRKLFKKKTC